MDTLSLLTPVLVAAPLIVFWLWMFAELVRNTSLPDKARYYWILAFLFTNVFAAIYYWATVYRDQS